MDKELPDVPPFWLDNEYEENYSKDLENGYLYDIGTTKNDI